ncbi:MAG TPA: ComF family protein [Actinomycetota bacterium]|nr:ComF family protein [Actinomycetota bacterium]
MSVMAGGIERVLGGFRCAGCGALGSLLCPVCRARVGTPEGDLPEVPNVDSLVCPWAYEGAARALILDLKVRGRRAAAGPLVDELVRAGPTVPPWGTTVTWVPGRRSDIRDRGFDHSELLARGVAARLGLRRAPLLVRLVDTPDQTGLSALARRRNLSGAFAARPLGGRIIVVDDVVTTGTTASTCARALKRRGAAEVTLLAPCRA